jgi:hypothetical protein
MGRRLSVCAACTVALLAPSRTFAQEPLSQLLAQLIQADIQLAPPPPGFVSHSAHFQPGANQVLAPYLFNQQLVTQLATFPIGSPSGGFVFSFDPATGTFQRATDSFGPSFAERALTNGRGKLTIGTNFQYSKYNSFEGKKLNDDSIKFYLTHAPIGGFFFEGDLVQAALRLNLSSATTTFFANYGVTDALDVAVGMPIVHVNMEATVDATILRLATGQSTVNIHAFPGGGDTASFSHSGSATGAGDLLVRAKYRFLDTPGGGLAAGVDVRLPTGDANQLLGTGAAAATLALIGSTSRGNLAPHFNVAFTGAGHSDVVSVANELGYKVGTEFIATPQITWTADLIGRALLSTQRLTLSPTVHNFMSSTGVPGSATFDEYVAQNGTLNLVALALGGKFNVSGKLLINANVLVALTSAGVTARLTPVVGFDYSF